MKSPAQQITIKELAAALNISHSTVSRALNGHSRISKETRDKVCGAAERLGYVANGAARLLKHDQGRVVGMVIPDIKNGFYSKTAKAIADAASQRSLHLVLCTTDDDPEREYQALRSLAEARATAVILAGTANPHPASLVLLARTDVVQLIRRNDAVPGAAVLIDEVGGLRLASAHLLARGHRRIAYVGVPETLSTGRDRLAGFRAAFADAGEAVPEDLIFTGSPRTAFGVAAFERVMAAKPLPTALVIASPALAEGILLAAQKRGVAIPEQLALVCYGDSPWHELVHGGLTAIHLPEEEIAAKCVDILFNGGEAGEAEQAVLAPTLVERRSSREM